MDYYMIQVGHRELYRHLRSDEYAIRVARRWARMFYPKEVASLPPWSVAAWIARENPTLAVYRFPKVARGVYSMDLVKLYDKPLQDLCTSK